MKKNVWRRTVSVRFALLLGLLLGCQTEHASHSTDEAWLRSWRAANPIWRGIHLSVHNEQQADALFEQLPKLAALSINVLIVEVNYGFEWQSQIGRASCRERV